VKTLLDPITEMDTRFRVRQLLPTSQARWGKTTPFRVLSHLVEALALPLGESEAHPSEPPPAPMAPVRRWVHMRSSPCPEHKLLITAELQPPDLASWKGTFIAWQEACTRFLARGRSPSSPPFQSHPVYGLLSHEEWGQVLYFHTDHHLRQFGA
jgi:hypothetical protein